MSDWKTVKLGDVCDVKRGSTITRKQTKEGNIPVIGGGTKPTYYHNEANRKENCITISGSGASAGFVNIWKELIFASDCSTIEPLDSTQDFYFVYFYLLSKQQFIYDNFRFGAAQPHVYAKDIATLEFPIIPLPEQQRIVAKLDAAFTEIDTAITATEKNVDSTSAIFNQVLSNVEGKKIKLETLINIKTGKLDSNAMVENGRYPFFTCSREIFAIDDYAFDCDAVLLAGNNASGDFNVKHYNGKFNAYQRTYVITVKDEKNLRSRYLYFQLINALAQFKEMSVGSGTKFLKIGMIQNLEIPLPAIKVQDKILSKLENLALLTANLNLLYKTKIINLTKLKSAILTQELQHGEL